MICIDYDNKTIIQMIQRKILVTLCRLLYVLCVLLCFLVYCRIENEVYKITLHADCIDFNHFQIQNIFTDYHQFSKHDIIYELHHLYIHTSMLLGAYRTMHFDHYNILYKIVNLEKYNVFSSFWIDLKDNRKMNTA